MAEEATQEEVTKEINPKEIMDFLKPKMGARFKTWVDTCTHCGMCADTCHYYHAHDRDPKMIPSYKVRFIKDILKKTARDVVEGHCSDSTGGHSAIHGPDLATGHGLVNAIMATFIAHYRCAMRSRTGPPTSPLSFKGDVVSADEIMKMEETAIELMK